MPERILRHLPDGWGTTELVITGAAMTVATIILSLVIVGVVVVRIPRDYFAGDDPPPAWADRHPAIRWPLLILKNVFAVFLILLGIVLSFPGVPGQGILTILIGTMLLNFPGKRRLEKWLLRRRGVLTAINKVRARYGRPPLVLDAPAAPA